MIRRTIRVHAWTVTFLFAHPQNDAGEVLKCLSDIGAPDDVVRDASKLMEAGPNCGFTVSDEKTRRSLSWVGRQSDGQQWLNTTVHEIIHVAVAMANDEGIAYNSERFAYLVGDITQEVADLMCFLACDHCREEKYD